MTGRLWRWPLALLLGLFTLGYLRALFAVFPAWSVLLGGMLLGFFGSRFLRRRRSGGLGAGVRQVADDV